LPPEAVQSLGERLYRCWERFRACFQTRTRDPSVYAYHYLTGQLRLETGRNFTGIGRAAGVPGQNMQHFMSVSPWSAAAVCRQVQAEIAALPGLPAGGVLILDESADEKSSAQTAGASPQRNGRLGKVEMSQVGTFLAYAHGPLWCWVAGKLFLPQRWFTSEWAARRQRLGIPAERAFATKIQLGWEMIQEVKQGPLPFACVLADALYGQSEWFRAQLDWAGLPYLVEVPADTQVFLTPPQAVARQVKRGAQRRTPAGAGPVWQGAALPVSAVAQRADTAWRPIAVRPIERGVLADGFAVRPVWTVREGTLAAELLVSRREANGRETYALSNLAPTTPPERLAALKCQRYFVERAIQDAKSEAGWDELEAQKYRAWEHHLALTVLAGWFIAQTKWEWAQQYERDPALAAQLAVDLLPALSMANVRTLLRSVMPLPQLSPEEATQRVVEHLLQRTRSRRSRLNSCRNSDHPP
jgi:SRSO17 transposase